MTHSLTFTITRRILVDRRAHLDLPVSRVSEAGAHCAWHRETP
jgi:hypothetical protein